MAHVLDSECQLLTAQRLAMSRGVGRLDHRRRLHRGSGVVSECPKGAFPICSRRGWTKGPGFDSLRVPRRDPWAMARGISSVARSVAQNWI